MERKVDDTVGGAVAAHVHLAPIGFGHGIDIPVTNGNRVVIIQFPERPGGPDGNAAQAGGNRIAEMAGHRLELADLDDEAGILAHGHEGRRIVRFADVHHLDPDRRLLVQVLHPLDEFGLVVIGRTQTQVLGHFQHRGFRTEDDDFVIDGVHRDGDTAVRDVFQRRGPALQPVPGDGIQADLGMALIDPVRPVAPIISDSCTEGSTENKPMQVPEDGIEDVFPGKGVSILFLQEREIGVIRILSGHKSNEINPFLQNSDRPGRRSTWK